MLLFLGSKLYSQGSSGENAKYESNFIVDLPTAGIIPKNTYSFNTNIFENSGITGEIVVSPFSDFNMGLSFSGSKIIGYAEPSWQKLPGVILKARLFDESMKFPALTVGFISQGKGEFINALNRFQTMSPGFFMSFSKSYTWKLGYLAIHGGINYSIEPAYSERTPNFYTGVEQSLGRRAAINLEYNATLDEKPGLIMSKRGLLNMSLRMAFTQNMTVEIQFIDLLRHSLGGNGIIRRLGIEYIESF